MQTRSLMVALIVCLLASTIVAQQTTTPGTSTQDEAVRYLVDLVKIDTSNPPGDEIRAARYIKGVLDREGITSEIVESAPGRASIIARIKGNGSKKPLLLMGHIDVVGVERSKWSVDPFAAVMKDGFLYGRGSEDDKAMDAVNLAIFIKLHRDKIALDRDVILLAEAGEEGTSQFGIDFLVEKHWDKINCEYALNEGGRFHLEGGKVQYAGVQTTEKVPRGLRVIAHGTSGHGSMPRLDNPVVHLSAAIAKIGQWQPPMRLNETTSEFFKRLATISPPDKAKLYLNVSDKAVQENLRASEIFYNSMLRTSISPTIIRGGFRENVIPGEAEAILDVRALPDEGIDQLIATLKKLVDDPNIEIVRLEGGQNRPATPPSSINNEMFAALERAQKTIYPTAITLPLMQTGATDGAQLRAKGVQVYGIGVPLTDDELRTVHGNDEHISVAELKKFVDYEWTAVIDVAAKK